MPGIKCFSNIQVANADFDIQDASITTDMCFPVELDLSTLVSGPSAGSVVLQITDDDGGISTFNSPDLLWISDKAQSSATVQFSGTAGNVQKNGQIDILLNNVYDEADIKAAVSPDFDTLDTAAAALNSHSTFYNGSYTTLFYRNLFCSTCDIYYWNRYKAYFDIFRNGATITIIVDDNSSVPCSSGAALAPKTSLGAEYPTYQSWPSCPSTKSLRQWGMTNMHMLHDVLCDGNPCGLPQAELDWARDAYDWIHRNVVDRLVTSSGLFQSGLRSMALSATAQINNLGGSPPSTATTQSTGYWDSHTMLNMCCLMLDDKLRACMRTQFPADYPALWDYQDPSRNGTMNDPLNPASYDISGNYIIPINALTQITVQNADYDTFFRWWVRTTSTIAGDCLIWDTVGTPSNNPNINSGEGFGLTTDYKSPDTGHASRIVYMAQLMKDLGCLTSGDPMVDIQWNALNIDDVLQRIGNTFGDKISYDVTENCVRMSSYIDGTDTTYRGGIHNGGGVDGMGSFIYQGWYLGAVYNTVGLKGVVRLLNWLRNEPSLSSGDPCYGGTYERHNSSFGRPGLYAALCDIKRRRKGL